ncbi:MAG: antibiotic biosynthesis monooxygenase [Dehalococcoidia bacterium]
MEAATAPVQTVTLVTQTRVLPDKDGEFAAWQQRMNLAVAAAPGFLDHTVIEPAPPAQLDWVIVQRFRSTETARAWLQSPERQRMLDEVQPILAGTDDIHLFVGDGAMPPDASVSAVISTRVAPGHEQAFRAWQRRIATAESAFPGFQGSKLEPPIAGVQADWATISRFDSEEHLQMWLTSDQRRRLLEEAATIGATSSVRTLRGGFEGWFNLGDGAGNGVPAIWKQNMVVLLVLYPIVFLYGRLVFDPILEDWGVPFWLDLFIAKVISVVLMGSYLMAPVNRRLRWWLLPAAGAPRWTNAAGAALVIAMYAILLGIFSRFP